MASAGDGPGGKGRSTVGQKRTILVVDDDAVVGHSINRVLSAKGYQVREALSGEEALAELDRRRYDLVFSDIRMPGMDGMEMTSRLKQLHPEVPVVVITGYGTEAGEKQARDLGVDGYLRKPLTPEMIIGNTERALRERQETLEAIRRSALTMMQPAPATAAPSAVTVPAAAGAVNVARNVALFFAAPFIGLAYILAFPFVGVWAIMKYGYQALANRS